MEHHSSAGAGPADCRIAGSEWLCRAQPASCEEKKLSMESSQVLPGFKVMFKKSKNISAAVCENRKRCETSGCKGRECCKLCTTNIPVNFDSRVILQHWKAMSSCMWQCESSVTVPLQALRAHTSQKTTDRYRQGSAQSQHWILSSARLQQGQFVRKNQNNPLLSKKCHLSE